MAPTNQHPGEGGKHEYGSQNDTGMKGGYFEKLESRGQQDERQRAANQAARGSCREVSADPYSGYGAHEERGGQTQLEVAEHEMPERRGGYQWHRLNQVSSDELAGLERRVQSHQGDDDQRSGTD